MKVKCPGCHTELDPTNTNCPVCLRPRTRKELLAGLKETRRPPPFRWGRVLLLVLAAAGVGYGGLYVYDQPLRPAPPAPVPQAQRTTPVLQAGPAPEAASAAAPAEQAAGLSGGNPGNTVLLRQSATPTIVDTRDGAAARRPQRAARRPAGWLVKGDVYDLLSLKPVAGAKIVFQDRGSGRAISATTDARGRYTADLPKVDEGGYDITVAKRGYTDIWLEEMSPPYRSQSRARRLEAAAQTEDSAVLHVPLLPERSQTEVPYDLVLFPRR